MCRGAMMTKLSLRYDDKLSHDELKANWTLSSKCFPSIRYANHGLAEYGIVTRCSDSHGSFLLTHWGCGRKLLSASDQQLSALHADSRVHAEYLACHSCLDIADIISLRCVPRSRSTPPSNKKWGHSDKPSDLKAQHRNHLIMNCAAFDCRY
jgi:hypothetical protein